MNVSNPSVDLDAPAKLKRDLDAVLTLQTELTQIDELIQHVNKAMSQDAGTALVDIPAFLRLGNIAHMLHFAIGYPGRTRRSAGL